MTHMTHCDSSVPTVGHSFFEALLPLVIIRTSPSSYYFTAARLELWPTGRPTACWAGRHERGEEGQHSACFVTYKTKMGAIMIAVHVPLILLVIQVMYARQLCLGVRGGNSIALKKGPKIAGPFSVPFSGAVFVLLNQD